MNVLSIYRLIVRDCDRYSLVHDQTNLLKFITIPLSVKSRVEDGRSLVVGNTYGGIFYWICDCIAVREILDYTGSIHQLRRWSRELFGYEFAIIRRATSIMKMSMA